MSSWDGVLTAGNNPNEDNDGASLNAVFVNAAAAVGTAWFSTSTGHAAFTTVGPVDVSNGPTYRPGGGAWTAADFIDDKTIFMSPRDPAGTPGFDHHVTSLWGEISYTPVSGGFVFLLNLAGLGALPFVGHLVDFAQFSRYLSWRRGFPPRHRPLAPAEA